jgi:hypothetical protein
MQVNSLTMDFLNIRAGLNDYDYLRATISYHAAPVYFGLKPSILLNLGQPDSRLARLWKKYNRDVDHYKGLSSVIFYSRGSMQLFYYDPDHINYILSDGCISDYLNNLGKGSQLSLEDQILALQQGFLRGCPHEIGVFLGYPLSDVKAFIRNGGKNYLLNGYWKVYSDVWRAVQKFQAFDMAKRSALSQWKDLTSH